VPEAMRAGGRMRLESVTYYWVLVTNLTVRDVP
jgi:hypothetical protein